MGYTKGSATIGEEVLLAELSWVRPYLAVGPRPDDAVWDLLVREKVSLVIDLNDDVSEGRMAAGFGLGYRGLKVPDPTGVEEFLAGFPSVGGWINAERVSGGRVYLHCTAGVYRSPTFAMAYLMMIGEPRDRAVQIVKAAHPLSWSSGDEGTLHRALRLWEEKLRLGPETSRLV